MRQFAFAAVLLGAIVFAIAPGASAASAPAKTAATGTKPAVAPKRIVCVNPGLTEIVLELGEAGRLCGVDAVTHDPRLPAALPRVGYQRALSAEGILALRPDLVLVTEDAGPPAAIASLRAAGVRLVALPGAPTVDALHTRVARIADLVGGGAKGRSLLERLERDAAAAKRPLAGLTPAPSALFVLSRAGAGMQVAGTGTAADALLRLAGAANATAQFEGYRPLSAEAALAASPAAIVATRGTVDAAGGERALLAAPGLASTSAARSGSLVVVDDAAILGFGPSAVRAALDLAERIGKLTALSKKVGAR